ncbi:MAG TPA: hypothetical protein V6D26_25200 [Stenomitos sp.]
MTDEKIKTNRLAPHWELPLESTVLHIERLVNGQGTPYSEEEAFSHEPPGVLATILRRCLYDENIPTTLKARLEICMGQIEYIVNPSWHQGYDACVSLKKRCKLGLETLQQTGNLEASYRYPFDRPYWYWFLAGWLSACRDIDTPRTTLGS